MIFEIEIPMYCSTVLVAIEESVSDERLEQYLNDYCTRKKDKKELIKELKHVNKYGNPQLGGGSVCAAGKGFILQSADEIGVLAHEVFHLTFRIMDMIGMEYSYKSEEAYAYLHEFIINSIYSKLKEEQEKERKEEKEEKEIETKDVPLTSHGTTWIPEHNVLIERTEGSNHVKITPNVSHLSPEEKKEIARDIELEDALFKMREANAKLGVQFVTPEMGKIPKGFVSTPENPNAEMIITN